MINSLSNFLKIVMFVSVVDMPIENQQQIKYLEKIVC